MEIGEEERSEEQERVFQCVMDIPDKYREVIYLFYYEEYSIKEIAGILEMKENTVKSLLLRGRKILEKKLKD